MSEDNKMQPFDASLDLSAHRSGAERWLTQKKRDAIDSPSQEASNAKFCIFCFLPMSFFACLFLVDQLHSVFLWVMEAGGVVGFISSVWALRRSLKAKSKAACEFEAEAVTRRARLLVQAEYAYKVYAEQYRLWHENVDGKPSAGELPKAERFYQFLVIVHHVLVKAFKNFERTSALADLRKNYLEEHGASGVAKADVALVEIMSQLNAPIELPESLLLPDPADALSREEAVAEVIADLDKEAPVFGLLPVNRSE